MLHLLLACAHSVLPQYEAEKAAVLAPLPAEQGGWAPDLRISVSESGLQSLAEVAMEAGLLRYDGELPVKNKLGIDATIRPSARVESMQLQPSETCDSCLLVKADLDGHADWSVGKLDGRLPFQAEVKAVMRFEAKEAGQAWDLQGRLTEIKGLRIQAGRAGSVDVSGLLEDWMKEAIQKAPTMPLGRIGGQTLPLRALRLSTSRQALEVQGLTLSPTPGAVAEDARGPREHWSLRLSQQSLLGLMRVMAFEKGPLSHDVAADPRGLSISGNQFDMELRLWRLVEPGWWRDYTVSGTLGLEGRKIAMKSTSAEEGEKSPRAELSDPLAWLGESKILEEVSRGISLALPATQKAQVSGLQVQATPMSVAGEGTELRVEGRLEVSAPASTGDRKHGQGRPRR
jgi:hypothetical protein